MLARSFARSKKRICLHATCRSSTHHIDSWNILHLSLWSCLDPRPIKAVMIKSTTMMRISLPGKNRTLDCLHLITFRCDVRVDLEVSMFKEVICIYSSDLKPFAGKNSIDVVAQIIQNRTNHIASHSSSRINGMIGRQRVRVVNLGLQRTPFDFPQNMVKIIVLDLEHLIKKKADHSGRTSIGLIHSQKVQIMTSAANRTPL